MNKLVNISIILIICILIISCEKEQDVSYQFHNNLLGEWSIHEKYSRYVNYQVIHSYEFDWHFNFIDDNSVIKTNPLYPNLVDTINYSINQNENLVFIYNPSGIIISGDIYFETDVFDVVEESSIHQIWLSENVIRDNAIINGHVREYELNRL